MTGIYNVCNLGGPAGVSPVKVDPRKFQAIIGNYQGYPTIIRFTWCVANLEWRAPTRFMVKYWKVGGPFNDPQSRASMANLMKRQLAPSDAPAVAPYSFVQNMLIAGEASRFPAYAAHSGNVGNAGWDNKCFKETDGQPHPFQTVLIKELTPNTLYAVYVQPVFNNEHAHASNVILVKTEDDKPSAAPTIDRVQWAPSKPSRAGAVASVRVDYSLPPSETFNAPPQFVIFVLRENDTSMNQTFTTDPFTVTLSSFTLGSLYRMRMAVANAKGVGPLSNMYLISPDGSTSNYPMGPDAAEREDSSFADFDGSFDDPDNDASNTPNEYPNDNEAASGGGQLPAPSTVPPVHEFPISLQSLILIVVIVLASLLVWLAFCAFFMICYRRRLRLAALCDKQKSHKCSKHAFGSPPGTALPTFFTTYFPIFCNAGNIIDPFLAKMISPLAKPIRYN